MDFISLIRAPLSCTHLEIAISILRMAIGIIMVCHGALKIKAGISTWRMVGSAMQNFGIFFLPTVWGIVATLTEFLGGFAFTAGFFTRIASFLLACMMVVAFKYHTSRGDSFSVYSHALTLLAIFCIFIVIGGTGWSVDSGLTTIF